jgi:Fe2+ transport system protein FeoA
MSARTLFTLGDEGRATIVRVHGEFALRERFAALGVRPGRTIRVVRRLGARGPLQVRVDHTDLVLRAAEAAQIDIEVAA